MTERINIREMVGLDEAQRPQLEDSIRRAGQVSRATPDGGGLTVDFTWHEGPGPYPAEERPTRRGKGRAIRRSRGGVNVFSEAVKAIPGLLSDALDEVTQ